MIRIVGATGVLGRVVAQQLLTTRQPVRLFVRAPAQAEDLRRLSAEVFQGDLIDPPHRPSFPCN